MADRVPTLPQPPIVWGPSEIDEWIRGSFPSEARTPSRPGPGRRIRRLTVKVWSDSIPPVRARVVIALDALGYRLSTGERPPLVFVKGERTVRVRFHPSLLGNAISVAADFSPPGAPKTSKAIASALAEEFPLGTVTMAEVPRRTKHARPSARR